MSYLENVIKASGGHAAPAEIVEEIKKEAPEGYHYMPDGTLMKDSAHENEAALEKDEDDPCWEGYVQLGMKKGKNGEMVPNCVPAKTAQSLEKVQNVLSLEEIEEILAHYNSKVGEARQVGLTAAAAVAERSLDAYYDSCSSGSELFNAVSWELHTFLEYATFGVSLDMDVVSEHDDLLNEGHPSQGLVASASSRVEWIAGAPELGESEREAIRFALSESASDLEAIHASSRIKALAASGAMSEATLGFVNLLITN